MKKSIGKAFYSFHKKEEKDIRISKANLEPRAQCRIYILKNIIIKIYLIFSTIFKKNVIKIFLKKFYKNGKILNNFYFLI